VLHGTVKRIGSDALPPDQLKQTYRYPAEIELASQQLQVKSGAQLPLQVGMSLTANIKLRKVSYLQLRWVPFIGQRWPLTSLTPSGRNRV
jgi:HlyD family secretion protein